VVYDNRKIQSKHVINTSYDTFHTRDDFTISAVLTYV